MIQLITLKQRAWHKPLASNFKIPKEQGILEKFQLPNTGNLTELTVPFHDEDW